MDVLMPQLGETVAEGKISKWFVAAGDSVKPGDNLFEIETDKVSMEVPAIAAGVLSMINVAAGETVPVGAVVAVIRGAGETVASAGARAVIQTPLIPAKAGIQKKEELGPRFRGDERQIGINVAMANALRPIVQMEPFREVRSPERNYGPARLPGGAVVTPLARRLAGEAGIDLTKIKGSGPHGRIVAADVAGAKVVAPSASAQAAANVVVTANVPLGPALALLNDTNGLALADVVVKAWAIALQRVLTPANTDIALSLGKSQTVIRDVASKSLSAIATARREAPGGDGGSATTGILMAEAAGIATITGVLRPPYTTMLSIGSQRRVPIEAEDGTVKFVTVVTAKLVCDEATVDAAHGADLLAAFKGYVTNPVTMIV